MVQKYIFFSVLYVKKILTIIVCALGLFLHNCTAMDQKRTQVLANTDQRSNSEGAPVKNPPFSTTPSFKKKVASLNHSPILQSPRNRRGHDTVNFGNVSYCIITQEADHIQTIVNNNCGNDDEHRVLNYDNFFTVEYKTTQDESAWRIKYDFKKTVKNKKPDHIRVPTSSYKGLSSINNKQADLVVVQSIIKSINKIAQVMQKFGVDKTGKCNDDLLPITVSSNNSSLKVLDSHERQITNSLLARTLSQDTVKNILEALVNMPLSVSFEGQESEMSFSYFNKEEDMIISNLAVNDNTVLVKNNCLKKFPGGHTGWLKFNSSLITIKKVLEGFAIRIGITERRKEIAKEIKDIGFDSILFDENIDLVDKYAKLISFVSDSTVIYALRNKMKFLGIKPDETFKKIFLVVTNFDKSVDKALKIKQESPRYQELLEKAAKNNLLAKNVINKLNLSLTTTEVVDEKHNEGKNKEKVDGEANRILDQTLESIKKSENPAEKRSYMRYTFPIAALLLIVTIVYYSYKKGYFSLPAFELFKEDNIAKVYYNTADDTVI